MEESKETKICKYCQSEIPVKAKVCPNCRKKQKGKRGLIAIIVVVVFFLLFLSSIGSGENKDENPQKVGQVETTESDESDKTNNVFHAGDVIETDDFRITYLSTGEYKTDNEWSKPKDGYVYWEFKFKFENISDSDHSVSSMVDWECYADNSKVDQSYIGDDNGLDATLSAGRETEGAVYFEVPKDAKSIELEYDINFWGSDKIVFVGK